MKQYRTRYRKIIVYADYFKNFRKTINKEALKKIYEVMTYIMTEENGYTKKSQRAPLNELEKANRIMKEYFQSKTK